MLAQGTYDADYIADCRAQVESDIAAFDSASVENEGDDHAVDDLEVSYFGALLLALELRFVRREREPGAKVGALDEVRLVADSLMTNGGRLLEPDGFTLDPASSVLGLRPGDDIVVRYADFVRLSRAFFAELESRYLD